MVAEGTPDELKRLRPRRPRPAAVRRRRTRSTAAAAVLDAARRDDDALDPAGPQRRRRRARCARCSTGSTPPAIDVDELAVHTPDLDDVFLALTGHHDRRTQEAAA